MGRDFWLPGNFYDFLIKFAWAGINMKRLAIFLVALAGCLDGVDAFAGDATAKADQAPEATTYQIRNVKHGDLLRPKDANSATGTPIVLYSAQPWKCMTWRLQPAGDSGFQVRNLFTAKTFCASSVAGASKPAVIRCQWPKAATDRLYGSSPN